MRVRGWMCGCVCAWVDVCAWEGCVYIYERPNERRSIANGPHMRGVIGVNTSHAPSPACVVEGNNIDIHNGVLSGR